MNASIVIISLPAIFRGIKLNPLTPSNVSYLLWMLMGYLVVSAVLVVTLGRLGDIYGRVRMYNLGFAIFALGALALPFDPFTGPSGALWLIGWRILQAVGGAMLMANSPAILTDAFPFNQRGMAMGINQVAGISGQFIGLILGGILAAVNWRLVFIVSVPIGIGGAIWSYLSLREVGARTPSRIDWLGNITFAVGLIGLLTGITYGIQPYGGHSMGWTSPVVLSGLIGGIALLIAFCFIELRVDSPMFDLRLLKIRSFSTGATSALLASISRGGMQFMLIIWLQGIWLVLHGYSFIDTPLWSGIYLLPLTAGFLIAGPLSGWLSDRYGARFFASGGLLLSARFVRRPAAAAGQLQLPGLRRPDLHLRCRHGTVLGAERRGGDEQRPAEPARRRVGHARHLHQLGLRAVHRHLLLADDRGARIHAADDADQRAHRSGRARRRSRTRSATCRRSAACSPRSSATTPCTSCSRRPACSNHLPAHNVAVLTGKQFFPQLISGPFHHGLVIVFSMAMTVLVIAALLALRHGGQEMVRERAAAETAKAAAQAEQAEETSRPDRARSSGQRRQRGPGGVEVAHQEGAVEGHAAGREPADVIEVTRRGVIDGQRPQVPAVAVKLHAVEGGTVGPG